VISKLKAYGLIDIPLVTVITDHTHHSYWLHAYTDHYLVGSYQVRQQLIRLGIPGRKISYTGIPIKPGFLKPQNKKELCAKYRLNPDLPTVLVMGGGDGIFASGLFRVEKLDTIPFSIQLLIVCGHNEKLRAQLEQNLKGTKHAVYIKGYVNDVTDLMAVSDCMVTKPGGVTTSEALAMELPMILYKALPGQEEDNAAFLIQAGAAVQAADEQDLLQKLIELLKHRERLAKMKNSTKNIQNKEAAFRALHVICQSKASKWMDTPKRQIPFMIRGKYSRMKKKAWLMNQPH
jgi:processive 1,2-diacylglycerol beta-glucosyltransferase